MGEYLEQLHWIDLVIRVAAADLPICEALLFLAEVREVAACLKREKEAGVCNISGKFSGNYR